MCCGGGDAWPRRKLENSVERGVAASHHILMMAVMKLEAMIPGEPAMDDRRRGGGKTFSFPPMRRGEGKVQENDRLGPSRGGHRPLAGVFSCNKAGEKWTGQWVYASQQRRGQRWAHSFIACRAFNDHTDSHPCEWTYHSAMQSKEEEQQAASLPASPGQGSKGRREQGGVDR